MSCISQGLFQTSHKLLEAQLLILDRLNSVCHNSSPRLTLELLFLKNIIAVAYGTILNKKARCYYTIGSIGSCSGGTWREGRKYKI